MTKEILYIHLITLLIAIPILIGVMIYCEKNAGKNTSKSDYNILVVN